MPERNLLPYPVALTKPLNNIDGRDGFDDARLTLEKKNIAYGIIKIEHNYARRKHGGTNFVLCRELFPNERENAVFMRIYVSNPLKGCKACDYVFEWNPTKSLLTGGKPNLAIKP